MSARKFGKALLIAFAAFIGLSLVLLLAVKLALDRVPAYQSELKSWVHQQTGLHIRFAHVSPTLRWYGPELYFDQLELRSRDDRRVLANAAGGRIGLDVRQLLRSGKLFAGRVELVAPEIAIARLGPDSFALGYEIELNRERSAVPILTLEDLPAGTLTIRSGRLTVQDWNASLPHLVLGNVNMILHRELDALTLNFDARLPGVLGGFSSGSVAATGLHQGRPLTWSGELRAREVSFAGWRRFLPEYLDNLSAGGGAFVLRAQGVGTQIARAELDFNAQAVVTQLRDGSRASFDQIGGLVTLSHRDELWTLSGRRVFASRAGRKEPESQFDVAWRADGQGLLELRARANYVHTDNLLPLCGLLPQRDLRERLLDVAPTGEWSDAYLELSRRPSAVPWRMRVAAKFHDAGFAALGRAPGIRGLTGSIAGDESGGHVALDSQQLAVSWPRQWQHPIAVETLRGTFYWNRNAERLLIATPALEARNSDAAIRAEFAVQLPADGDSPQMTLVSSVDAGNIANAKDYLPRAVIGPKALAWLDRAFLGGRLRQATVLLQGPLHSFPFRDGSGQFLARLGLDGLTLDYADGWPPIENMAGQAEFHNEGLRVHLAAGNALGIMLESGDARFADFKSGELAVTTVAAGDAAAALTFLRATPLDALADGAFSGVEATGGLRAGINLFLPFKDFPHRRVLVHGELRGASLRRPGSPLAATDVAGDFDVDGPEVARADIRGRLLGGTFRLSARAPKKRPLTRTQLELAGTLSGDALQSALELPANFRLNGLTEWRAVARIAPAPARERSVRVSTNLVGIESELPDPLRKPADRALPARLEVQWPAGSGPQLSLNLGQVARAALAFEPDPGGARLAKAAVQFGGAEPVFSNSQVVNVGGKIGRLNVGAWQGLAAADKKARPLSYYVRAARIDCGEIDYFGLAFRDVGLDLAQSGDHWRLTLDGPDIAGTVTLPAAAQSAEPWDLNFTRLRVDDPSPPSGAVAEAAPIGESNFAMTPGKVPALAFRAKDLRWGDRHLGDVRAVLSRRDDGISLDELAVTNPSFTVKSQGEWRGRDAGLGRISGSLASTDVQSTLTQLGYADVIAAKTGRVDFDLNWLGAPTADALREAVGHVQVSLDHGQVIGLKPGAGRMLGLASVAELPRRLALDFSDLTSKGLTFDSIRGDFDLRGGDAYTDNLLLKGPSAEIGLIGRVGLKAKDYDQTAVVTGSVGNSLPIAGALAGGPVVGAAVLLFTQVFKQPLRGLARGYYRITGDWGNPTVERIKGADAAAATAEVPR